MEEMISLNQGGEIQPAAGEKTDGSSTMAVLQEAGPLEKTTKTLSPINPSTMMMAAALYSIEQDLKRIEEIQKEILSFLRLRRKLKSKRMWKL